MDIRLKADSQHFELRAVAIVIRNDRILVMRHSKELYYYTPGGALKLHETARRALKRELEEELGLNVEPEQLLWVTESFSTEAETKECFHQVTFYYLVNAAVFPEWYAENDFECADRTEGKLCWKALTEMQTLNFHPAFIKNRLNNLPDLPEHLIISE